MSREPSEGVKLKECPWCGSHAEVLWSVSEGSRTAGCSNPLCAVHPVAKKSTDPAVTIERWQNRVPSESVNADLLAACKEAESFFGLDMLAEPISKDAWDEKYDGVRSVLRAAIAKAENGEAVSEDFVLAAAIRLRYAEKQVIACAVAWGESSARNARERCDADFNLSMALIDLREARNGEPSSHHRLPNGNWKASTVSP